MEKITERFMEWLREALGFIELPILKAMPDHVDAVRLDRGLLMLHFERAERPNTAVVTGYPTGNHTKKRRGRK